MEAHFCPVLPDNENSVGLFEGFQVLPAFPSHKISIKMKIITARWCSNTDRERLKYLEENPVTVQLFTPQISRAST
jgi:hypothetical protein